MANLRLRDLREDRDLIQAEMADHLKIARTTYARYETGEREMTYDSLIALADFFSVSVDYLLGRYGTNPMILEADEAALVKRFRGLDGRGRQTVLALAEHESSQARAAAKNNA